MGGIPQRYLVYDFWYYILLAFGAAALALTLILSVAGRAKAPGFFRNTVIYKLFLLIFRTLGRIPMVWRTMLIWVCWCFVDLYFTFSNSYYYDSLLPAFWVISRAVLTIVILYLASSLRLLQKEGQAIADGQDRKSTRLNSSHSGQSRMPSSA